MSGCDSGTYLLCVHTSPRVRHLNQHTLKTKNSKKTYPTLLNSSLLSGISAPVVSDLLVLCLILKMSYLEKEVVGGGIFSLA
jgi:hypothetical protein